MAADLWQSCCVGGWEEEKAQTFIVFFDEGQTHCNIKGKTSDNHVAPFDPKSQNVASQVISIRKPRVELGMSLTELCFLVEDYTCCNIYSQLSPSLFSTGKCPQVSLSVFHPSLAAVTARLCPFSPHSSRKQTPLQVMCSA